MIAIEKKVVSFQKENDEVQGSIIAGSDAHLDILLQIKGVIDPLADKFSHLMNDVIIETNSLTIDEINQLIPALLDLYSSSIKLVASIKRSRIVKDLKVCAQNYFSQVENLREIIYDLETHRVNDDGLEEILGEINSF